ncbi:hypothetical protein Tco_1046297 [Tanacetum coccineum]
MWESEDLIENPINWDKPPTVKMEILLEPTSNKLMEHLKMEMEIPCSNKIKFITACSFSNDSFEDIMKAQVSVIKASATLNIQAFKIKKSVSISFRMTQVHKMAKDHMMMIKDYDDLKEAQRSHTSQAKA